MAELRITSAGQAYYGDLYHSARDFDFGDGRYVFRAGENNRMVIIDRQARVKMTTNIGTVYTPETQNVVYRAGDDYSPLDKLVFLGRSMYVLPGADERAVRKFRPLTDGMLTALVERYKASNPDAWERIPREHLENALKGVRTARGVIVGVFAVVLFFASTLTAYSVEQTEGQPAAPEKTQAAQSEDRCENSFSPSSSSSESATIAEVTRRCARAAKGNGLQNRTIAGSNPVSAS